MSADSATTLPYEAGVGIEQLDAAGDQHLVDDQLEQPQHGAAEKRCREDQEDAECREAGTAVQIGREPSKWPPEAGLLGPATWRFRRCAGTSES